ncbi:MAG: translocation/assembly module TamB domain-containing protein [Rhodobacteraceae bacterium]|nr:translocation/assembly module TamB domain-containing protein [Paracoccaceae bacterium]
MGLRRVSDLRAVPSRRRRRRVLAASLALSALLAAPAIPQDTTENEDVGLLASTLQDLLSDAGREVRIRGFEGALSSRATVRQISIADDQGIWITLSDVVIDWNRSALFNRRVEINELSAGRIDLARLPATAPADTALPSPTAREDFSLPELPVAVHIGEVRADLVHLDPPVIGTTAEFTLTGAARLQGGQGEARFDAHRTDGQEGAFRFSGDFDNQSRHLTLDLDLTEGRDGIVATLLNIPERPSMGLGVHGAGPISTFAADIALSTDDEERVSGTFAVVDETPETGVLAGGGFSVDIEGDLRPLLVADLHPFFGPSSRLRATGQRSDQGEIDLPELAISTGAMRLNGSAAISPQGVPRSVHLTAGIERGDGEPVLLPGTSGGARLGSATLYVNYDEAESRDWSVRAEIDTLNVTDMTIGTATLDGRGRLNATGQTPLPGGEGIPLFEGVLEFQAQNVQAADPALQQAIGSSFFGLTSLNWPGPEAPLELTGLAFEGQTVSLTAYGQLSGLDFDGFVEFEAPTLSAFSALAGRPLGGHALATVQGSANPLTGALDLVADLTTQDLSVGIAEADALLAGEAGINLSLRRDTEGTTLRALSLTAGTLQLVAEGSLEPEAADVNAHLVASDLSRLGEGYGGRATLDARLSTTASATRLQLDGEVSDLALAELPAAGILGGIFTGTNRLNTDLVIADGVTRVVQATLQGPRLDLAAEGAYSAEAPDLSLVLNRLDIAALTEGGRGHLSGRAAMSGEAGVTRYALSVDGNGPLATGIDAVDSLIGSGLTLEARATAAADGSIAIDSARLRAEGLNASVSGLQRATGAARFAVDAAIANIGQLVPGIGGQVTLNGDVTRDEGAAFYGVDLRLAGPSGLAATASGRVNDDFTVALTMNGQANTVMLNPSMEPASVSGTVSFNGTMNGRPGLDALRMNLNLTGGRYSLPPAGIAFSDISARAQLTGAVAQVDLTGTSLSGGRGAISGRIRLDQGSDADLRVEVSDFVVQQPRLYEARVSGAFRLNGRLNGGALVSGDVTVDTAEIRIPNSPLGRAGLGLQGLTHVAEDQASRQTRINAGIATGTRVGAAPVPLRLDLRLNAPGRVFVRGRGLDAELGGTLRLGGTTRNVVPAGNFTLIRGRLDLLGNRFTLTDGSASMVGSFMPFVRLTATTESDGVLTSVTLSGQADSPEITFSSTPELPQDEVLARLIFRRALTSLSPFQAAQLAMSVATLTGRADNSILSRTRAAMGLDDLDFTVNDEGNTQLRAGRHIGDRVYTDVSVDSTGQGEVTINLDLTDSIRLRGRADTSGGSGLGLFFERDY